MRRLGSVIVTLVFMVSLVWAGVLRTDKPKAKSKIRINTKIVEIHRVVAGEAAYSIGPNFYDNDWDAGDISVLRNLPADDVAYLRSITNLSSGVTYYIDLDGRTYNTTGFTDQVIDLGVSESEEGDVIIEEHGIKEVKYNQIAYVYDYSPIILDLDMNQKVDVAYGYWLPHAPNFYDINPRKFDITGDGVEDYVEWLVGPNDGLLVVPSAETVRSALDLFGTAGGWDNGFEKLATYDRDGNGWVEGDELAGFKIWIDENMNAVCEPGELFPIEEFHITRLMVKHTNYVSIYYTDDGKVHRMWDWWPAAIMLRKYR